MSNSNAAPLKVFCSYCHADEQALKQLRSSLAGLRRQGLIDDWYDRKIPPGGDWDATIKQSLESASLILLLISADFVNSDYCMDLETARAIERSDEGTATVIPIYLRRCDIEGLTFQKLQGTPRDQQWITEQENRDKAWTEVSRFIGLAVNNRLANPQKNKPSVNLPIELYKKTWRERIFQPRYVATFTVLLLATLVAAYFFWQSTRHSLAENLLQQGEYQQAQQTCEKAPASSARERCLLITRLMLEKHEVETFYADANQADSAYALAIMAESEAYKEDFSNAEKHYREAIRRNSKLAQAYFGMGQIRQMQNQPVKALKWYQQAVDKAPKNRRFVLNLASVYAEQGELERAAQYYRNAISLDSRFLLAYAELIDVLLKQKKQTQAQELAQTAQRILRDNSNWQDMPLNAQEWFVTLQGESFYLQSKEDKLAFLNFQLQKVK